MFNKKDEKIRKLWERGIRDQKVIAQKLGFNGSALTAGVQRVEEGLKRLGIVLF